MVFDEGKYHMYVSVMPPGSNLSNWGQSLVEHAVSTNILGPYEYNRTTLRPGHNPSIVKLPNGTFALFSILQYGVHTSPSPYGPWAYVKQAVDCKEAKQPLCYCNNPAPWIHANGTIFLSCGGGGPNVDGMWRSQNLTGPWQRVPGSNHLIFNHIRADGNRFPYGGGYEDPYLYFDARNNIHLLFHAYMNEGPNILNASCRNTLVSAHAFSADGYTWYTSPGQPYPSQVQTDANQTLLFWSRERPKIYWEGGKMTHLVTAVSPVPDPAIPDSEKFSSCRHGLQCSYCKGMAWDYTLVAELDRGN